MSRVFTIYNHGTDFHRDMDKHEVVTELHDAAAGSEARVVQAQQTNHNPSGFRLEAKAPTFMICEGPGSDAVTAQGPRKGVRGMAHAHPGVENPILNTSKDWRENPFAQKHELLMTPPSLTNPHTELVMTRSEIPMSSFRKGFVGHTPKNIQTTGRALGTGWDDNVYRASWMLTHLLFERKMKIDTVNLMGWSRGAVTCIKQANKLYEIFGMSLKLNIFAIDPVPGGYTTITDDIRFIPPNVQDMLVILAVDDDRSTFQALDAQDLRVLSPPTGQAPAPQVHFLPLPGNHSDVVFTTKGNAPQSARLCAHLAYKFLLAHGTKFSHPPKHGNLTVPQILDAYDTLRANRTTIKTQAAAKGNPLVNGFRRQERRVRKSPGDYVSNPHRWVNEHHRLCALSPNLQAVDRSAIQVSPGEPYSPWQAMLPQMGIAYGDTHPPARTLVRL
ncbi:hypothetical protein [Archangium violaceum]|uniref:DUF5621 domain-containing protein n=1 Tax=Archangium violaceum Cb vi76 TaxID=1406225 RepID=A0A084STY5_9BACT|nr:hypothetical protein [Archangium violaceum]KFA91920.1 hypothetical protein Q664_18695 [Archangium violaceum Cb vi76]